MSNDDVENSNIWVYPNPYTRNITVGSDPIDRLEHTNNIEYLNGRISRLYITAGQ